MVFTRAQHKKKLLEQRKPRAAAFAQKQSAARKACHTANRLTYDCKVRLFASWCAANPGKPPRRVASCQDGAGGTFRVGEWYALQKSTRVTSASCDVYKQLSVNDVIKADLDHFMKRKAATAAAAAPPPISSVTATCARVPPQELARALAQGTLPPAMASFARDPALAPQMERCVQFGLRRPELLAMVYQKLLRP